MKKTKMEIGGGINRDGLFYAPVRLIDTTIPMVHEISMIAPDSIHKNRSQGRGSPLLPMNLLDGSNDVGILGG